MATDGGAAIDAEALEASRLARQAELESRTSRRERNRLGQYATPARLAREIVEFALSQCSPGRPISFLDPALGTGAFYAALLGCARSGRIASAVGFEIDAAYAATAKVLWKGTPLKVCHRDFTRERAPGAGERATVLLCNPPYVRHHHLGASDKARLRRLSAERAHIRLSGLAGLYCHFMAIAHGWMEPDCIAGWLVPSEFMEVNYGCALKEYLLSRTTLLRIHRFDPNEVQFDDALVSSAVVCFLNRRPSPEHLVQCSYGGTLRHPAMSQAIRVADLAPTEKWTRLPMSRAAVAQEGYRLGDLFSIRRGLATGGNDFFILDEAKASALELPRRFLRPVLPSARFIREDEIDADTNGVPRLSRRLFLIDCDLPADELRRVEPVLWSYLRRGLADVAARHLCRSRRVWYLQERRPAAPIVCTYIGRSDHEGRPFRFLLNHSQATATNAYLMMYPTALLARRLARSPEALRAAWRQLNAIGRDTLLASGRVYGGGMHKLEPRELASVPADALARAVGLPPKRALEPLEPARVAARKARRATSFKFRSTSR